LRRRGGHAQHQINQLVYRLFAFTAEEISLIETSFSAVPRKGCSKPAGRVVASGMVMNNTSQMLPEVMSKVAGMGPATLQAVHRFIHLMELNALVEDLKDEAEGLRIAGKLEPALLDAAVREHRQKHG
jgi:hypothetical protein